MAVSEASRASNSLCDGWAEETILKLQPRGGDFVLGWAQVCPSLSADCIQISF